jgi:hypothetical protein
MQIKVHVCIHKHLLAVVEMNLRVKCQDASMHALSRESSGCGGVGTYLCCISASKLCL